MRQTDSGSDNMSWVTFAVHLMLVREGVLNQIDWLRLRAGHSHNEADAAHRLALGVFYPRKGVGIGCCTPMEFEVRLVDGLKTMNGGCEMLWQLKNFSFDKWLEGCVSKEFGHFMNERWWRFQFDASLTSHGFVRVTYKTNITDVASTTEGMWKPHVLAPADSLMQKVSLCTLALAFEHTLRRLTLTRVLLQTHTGDGHRGPEVHDGLPGSRQRSWR